MATPTQPANMHLQRPSWITEFVLDPRALNIQGMGQSLSLSQARIDAILDVVNLAQLKHAAQEKNGLAYVRELFQELGLSYEIESEEKTAQSRFVKALLENDGSDVVQAMRLELEEQKREEKILEEEREEIHEALLAEKQQVSLAPKPQPTLVFSKPFDIKDMPNFERFLELLESQENPHFSRCQLAEAYEVIRRLHCDDMIKYSDVELSDFLIERFSDGSYNIIANGAQYAGLRIMPGEINQAMKETGELAKGMVLAVFAQDDKAVQLIQEQVEARSNNAPTPFAIKPEQKPQ